MMYWFSLLHAFTFCFEIDKWPQLSKWPSAAQKKSSSIPKHKCCWTKWFIHMFLVFVRCLIPTQEPLAGVSETTRIWVSKWPQLQMPLAPRYKFLSDRSRSVMKKPKLFLKTTTDRMLFNGIELTRHLERTVHKYLNALLGQKLDWITLMWLI